MERERFEDLVEQALGQLPEVFRKKLANVVILIEDAPPGKFERGDLLLGLFHGIPMTEKSVQSPSFPDRIVLYQKSIEAVCSSEAQVRRQIRDTLLHEVGHYFGLSEEDLRNV